MKTISKKLIGGIAFLAALLVPAELGAYDPVIKEVNKVVTHYNTLDYASEQGLAESVVVVQTSNSHGTGFFVAEDLVITNYHVIASKNSFTGYYLPEGIVQVTVQTKDGQRLTGQVIGHSRDEDLALLKIIDSTYKGKALSLATEDAALGTKIFSIGHGNFKFYQLITGLVNRYYNFKTGLWNNDKQLMTMKVDGGQSGSPVFNYDGKVVGVVVGKTRLTDPPISIMIPVTDVIDLMLKSGLYKPTDTHTWTYDEQTKKFVPTLYMPFDAFTQASFAIVYDFCKYLNIEIIVNKEKSLITFKGPKPYLTAITNFILRGKPLPVYEIR
jgi:S1-C subfamily serine protease